MTTLPSYEIDFLPVGETQDGDIMRVVLTISP